MWKKESIFLKMSWNGGDLTQLMLEQQLKLVKDSLLGAKNGGFSACLEFIST